MTEKPNRPRKMSSFLPHEPSFQYGTTVSRHCPRLSSATRYERFFTEKTIGQLTCRKDDIYEDGGGDFYVYTMKFCPLAGKENLLAICDEEGVLALQDTTKSGEESIVLRQEVHDNAIFDVSFAPFSDIRVATASGNQTVKILDIEAPYDEARELNRLSGPERSIKCVEFAPENPNLIATGSRDNTILVWDLREHSVTNKPCVVIEGAHPKFALER